MGQNKKNASWPHTKSVIAALLDLYWLGCSANWGVCPFLSLVDNPNLISIHSPFSFEIVNAL